MKRALSLFLAMCLLISLLPASIAGATATEIVYTFTRDAIGASSNTNVSAGIKSTSGGEWEILSHAGFNSTPQLAGQALKLVANQKSTANQSYILFKVKISESGSYTPSVIYAPDQTTEARRGKFNVYLVSDAELAAKSLSSASTGAEIAAAFSPLNSSPVSMKENTSAAFPVISLTASAEASHYLMVEVYGASGKVEDQVHLTSFTLTPSAGDPDPNPNPDPEPEPDADASTHTYTFNRTVAGADAALNVGEGVEAKQGSYWKYLTHTSFNSVPLLENGNLKLVANRKSNPSFILFEMKVEQTATFIPTVKFFANSDANRRGKFNVYFFSSADLAAKNLTAASAPADIAAQISPLNSSAIDSKAEPEAVSATFAEIPCNKADTFYFMVEVAGVTSKADDQVYIESFILEPKKADPEPEPDDPNDDGISENVLDYNFNCAIAGVGEGQSAAVGTKSNANEKGQWEVVKSASGFSNYALYDSYLMLTQSNALNGIVFKIKVDKTRMYMPSVTYRTRNRGAYLEAYLVDEATAKAAGVDILSANYSEIYEKLSPLDNTKVDLYVDNASTSSTGVRYNYRGCEIKKGSYYLIFRANGKNPANVHAKPQLFIEKFSLETAENCLQYVELSSSKNTLNFGETAQLTVSGLRLDSTVIPENELTIKYVSSDAGVVSVDENGILKGLGIGKSKITVTVSDGNNTVSNFIEITATDDTAIAETTLTAPKKMYVTGSDKLSWKATLESGNILIIPFDTVSCECSEDGIVEIDSLGNIKALKEGNVTVTLSATFRNTELSKTIEISVGIHEGKTEPTFYTYEKRANALENVAKYDWARKEMKSATKAADKYLENLDAYYDAIAGEGIPRSNHVGYLKDPTYTVCKWCGVDVTAEYGSGKMGGWLLNVVTDPWKIQCPGCKRKFPSNDFALLYERGLDENGLYNRELAIENNKLAVANGEKDALVNLLYPELASAINIGAGLREGETVSGWGVDDGFGYVPRDKNGNNFKVGDVDECHAYIPYYMNYAWNGHMSMITTLAEAYLYTGDIKYGRAGAILMDRIADFYPTFNASKYKRKYHLSDGGSKLGHIQGRISESSSIASFALNIDALYPAISDPQVISYLSKKAIENGTSEKNSKSSAEEIWRNWEENMLMMMPVILKTGRAAGNTGLYQYAMACAAIVLDREPYTTEMIEWIYANDDINTDYKNYNTTTLDDTVVTVEGGDFGTLLINTLDRDGVGNESAAGYNAVPISRFSKMADVLSGYKGEKVYNPYDHPKYVSLLTAFIPLVTINNQTINVGDNIGTAQLQVKGSQDAYISLFGMVEDEAVKKQIAEFLYLQNGKSVEGLTGSIFSKDPDNLSEELEKYIDGNPVFPSIMMTGYGFAVLRDGEEFISATSTADNTLRDFWMYFGGFASHGHGDTLNLGIEAFGLNIAPDLGYAEEAGTDPMRLQWVGKSLSHNVISVNQGSQTSSLEAAIPMNFDDSGKVKFMDISASDRFASTSEYRRAVVMVEVDDGVSYGVDFFRVKGGDQHTFSFHSQAENAYGKEGLDFTPQWDENGNYITGAQTVPESGEYTVSYWNERDEYVTEPVYKEKGEYIGSYADIKHEVGKDPNSPDSYSYQTVYPAGYAWLGKVRRDNAPENKFSVEFDVEDYRKTVSGGNDIVLRVTQMNDFTPDEVSLVSGPVPNRSENKPMPSTLDYMLVQRSGKDLDSLFTTVYEPYKGERYLSDMNAVEIKVSENSASSPSENDIARAVAVDHTNGRRDYVIYATNPKVTYTVGGKYEFRGSAGVITVNANGDIIYRYVCNGDIIGEATEAAPRITGTVAGFSEDIALKNYIDVNVSDEVVPEALSDRYIYIENDGVENGVYRIESASEIEDGKLRLDIGKVTPIRAYRDKDNLDAGFIYNIATSQRFEIPMSYVDSGAPVFSQINDMSTSAGSTIKTTLKATTSFDGVTVTYEGTSLPRGAMIDSESGEFTWKPESSQIGKNHIAITAIDSEGRRTTKHFYITVYGSTTSGGGGSGSSSNVGTTTTPTIPATPSDGKDETSSSTDNVGDGVLDVPQTPNTDNTDAENVRFIDLGNHAWAADAINSLADEGIIKGTSENTFSPAANITRADFAILLVRAFKLASENTENFADVAESDYFAAELAIARNTGIVNGIGDNKYAPRANITRQDMMVIVYRALAAMGKINVGDGVLDVPQASDFNDVADYARDAVSALINAKLINGKNGLIDPTANTTRAEVAVLIRRILDFVK